MIDQVWAYTAIESCLRRGIDHFFLAPGSRCTPLTLAVARHEAAQTVQHFDERGLAFAALGYARATGRPGVFVCTSGTAVANAFPAVIEAAMEGVPMLLFTADRPVELRGTGANQTINQLEIFGDYASHFLNVPVPSGEGTDGQPNEDPSLPTFPSEALQQAIAASSNGPVHVNWMFREPFTIDVECESSNGHLRPREQQSADCDLSGSVHGAGQQDRSQAPIKLVGNVLIALGGCQPGEAEAARQLSARLNCPMLCDITSGLRGPQMGTFELPTEFNLPTPDTVLHLGGRIVSKTWHQWTAALADKGTNFVHVTPTGQTVNPNGLAIHQVRMPLANFDSRIVGAASEDAFRHAWEGAGTAREQVLRDQLSSVSQLSEPAVAFHLSQSCDGSSGLFIGNSMPIRDLDWFGVGANSQPRFVAANRGASGIDGLLATAAGYATGLQKPTTVVLGDLSSLHDLNSLALVAKSTWPLIVVILNNGAGHIFDQLPIRRSEHFEQYFATPHGLGFEHAAKMFGLEYRQVSDMEGFSSHYQEACSLGRSIVLELLTDREFNQQLRSQIREKIRTCSDQV